MRRRTRGTLLQARPESRQMVNPHSRATTDASLRTTKVRWRRGSHAALVMDSVQNSDRPHASSVSTNSWPPSLKVDTEGAGSLSGSASP